MLNKGIALQYIDITPNAKENFSAKSEDVAFENGLQQLMQEGLTFSKYSNPCEEYSTLLDGTFLPLPYDLQNAILGFWSNEVSGEDGVFSSPVVLVLESDLLFSSNGFTLRFDTNRNVFPTNIKVQWFKINDGVDVFLGEELLRPNNSVFSFSNLVDSFNKVVFTFNALNTPKNRFVLQGIDFGAEVFFYGDELKRISLIQEIDPISTEISINTADFEILSHHDYGFSFQPRQSISIYWNGSLVSKSFIKTSKRTGKRTWKISSEDYIGVLDGISFNGGMYENALAADVLDSIFKKAGVPYSIDSALAGETVSGHIAEGSCRDALMQVAFAIRAAVDTSNENVVRVFRLSEEIKQSVPLERVKLGQNIEDEKTVTSVEVVAHSYKKTESSKMLYEAERDGVGESIYVSFNEPIFDLQIENGKIIESGANFAKIDASEGCTLQGKRYEHNTFSKTKNNEFALSSEQKNNVVIDRGTLVSTENLDKVLDSCYNWFVKKSIISSSVIEASRLQNGNSARYGQKKYGFFKFGKKQVLIDKPIRVGDNIAISTEYLGEKIGTVVSQRFSLNRSNGVVKNIKMKV